MATRNQRKFSRSGVHISALMTVAGVAEPVEVGVVDVSMSGMFIHADARISVGDACHITILMGHYRHELPIEAEAQVVRISEAGTALRFTKLYLDRLPALKSLIVDHSQNPERAQVEFSQGGGWIFTP